MRLLDIQCKHIFWQDATYPDTTYGRTFKIQCIKLIGISWSFYPIKSHAYVTYINSQKKCDTVSSKFYFIHRQLLRTLPLLVKSWAIVLFNYKHLTRLSKDNGPASEKLNETHKHEDFCKCLSSCQDERIASTKIYHL